MCKEIIENGWDSKLSSYNKTINKKDQSIIKITGRYVHHQAMFEFSLNAQKSGPYTLRGSVRAIDKTGNVLKMTGKKAQDILNKLPEDQRKKNNSKLDIRSNVYTSSADDETIKAQITDTVQKLYSEYTLIINADLMSGNRPETITPNMAAQTAAVTFIAHAHSDASLETRTQIDKRIKNLCSKLPAKPMQDFKKTHIRNWAKENAIGEDSLRLLCRFWEFCVESRVCLGKNPIEEPKKHRRKTGEIDQYAAARRTSMDLSEQKTAFYRLSKVKEDYAVGFALMCSGFDASFIRELKCKDIIIRKGYDDYVVIRNINDKLSTATKDYSRPVVPIYAEIIKNHYKHIQEENPGVDVGELYFIRNPKSNAKPINRDTFINEITRMISEAGVKNATIAYLREEDRMVAAATKLLKNTYKENLYRYCNLSNDSGTVSFLLGRSLGNDVTSDSYTSFTSPAGEKRLYYILRAINLAPKKSRKTEYDFEDETTVEKKRLPEKNCDALDCTITIVLAPGEEARFECLHGLYGEITTKETNIKEEQLALKF